MKGNLIFVLLIINFFYANSQREIRGQVLYQNSHGAPAQGVLVGAKETNSKSDSEGYFTLKFLNTGKKNESVSIFIGEFEDNNITYTSDGKEVELVNIMDLKHITIPRDPANAPLREIIICPKGSRDIVAQKYYNIIKTESDEKLKQMRIALKKLKKSLGEANKLVVEKSKEIELYQKLNDSLNIYKEAFEIASINKDRASIRIKNYLEAWDSGVSLEEARKELNTAAAYSESIIGGKTINSSIIEIENNAKNYLLQGEYLNAITQYDTITLILNNNNRDKIEIVNNLHKIGGIYKDAGLPLESIECYNKAINILDNNNYKINFKERADLLYSVGNSYKDKYEYLKAEKSLLKATEIYETLAIQDSVANHFNLSLLYGDVAAFYIANEDLESASEFIKKTEENLKPYFLIENHKYGYLIGNFARLKATLYQKLHSPREQEKLLMTAIEIDEMYLKAGANQFDELFIDYYRISKLYSEKDRVKSKLYSFKAKQMLDSISKKGQRHKYIYHEIHLNNQLSDLHKFDNKVRAIDLLKKNINIIKTLEEKDPTKIEGLIANCYSRLGRIYITIKENFNEGKSFINESIKIYDLLIKKGYSNFNDEYFVSKLGLASIYLDENNDEQLEATFKEVFNYFNKKNKENPTASVFNLSQVSSLIGNYYLNKNNPTKAINYLKIAHIAIEGFAEMDSIYKPNLADVKYNYGRAKFKLKDYISADTLFVASLNIYKELENISSYKFRNKIGSIYLSLGELKATQDILTKSEKYYLEAFNIWKSKLDEKDILIHEKFVKSNIGLINIYTISKEYGKIESLITNHLDLYREKTIDNPEFYGLYHGMNILILCISKIRLNQNKYVGIKKELEELIDEGLFALRFYKEKQKKEAISFKESLTTLKKDINKLN